LNWKFSPWAAFTAKSKQPEAFSNGKTGPRAGLAVLLV